MWFSTILVCIVIAVSVSCDEQVPEQLDWREKGAVGRVKDQLDCDGSFYFAALGVVESHYYLLTGELLDLSEQSALDCSEGFNGGCFGGAVLSTIDFIRSLGILLEADYPYTGVVQDCQWNDTAAIFKTVGYKILPRDEKLIKDTVGTIGPVAVTFNVQDLSSYSGGIYKDSNCGTNEVSGLIVGYGTTDDGEDYWLIKMSYGTSWGEDGYIKYARNADNLCGIADNAVYPLL